MTNHVSYIFVARSAYIMSSNNRIKILLNFRKSPNIIDVFLGIIWLQ